MELALPRGSAFTSVVDDVVVDAGVDVAVVDDDVDIGSLPLPRGGLFNVNGTKLGDDGDVANGVMAPLLPLGLIGDGEHGSGSLPSSSLSLSGFRNGRWDAVTTVGDDDSTSDDAADGLAAPDDTPFTLSTIRYNNERVYQDMDMSHYGYLDVDQVMVV
jgi:hypothetical protein